MKRLLVIGLLLIVGLNSQGQYIDNAVAGAAGGMGRTYIIGTDNWGSMSNEAALGWHDTYWVGVNHESRFALKELSISTIASRIVAKPGAFCVNISYTGYSGYNITRAGVTYGMAFGQNFSAGVGFSFHHARYSSVYNSQQAYTVSAGLQYKISEEITVGAHLFNPFRSSLDPEITSPPTALGIGMAYKPSEIFTLTLQVDDDIASPTAVRAGMEYRPFKTLFFRLGYSSVNPEGITGGLGIDIKSVWIDLNASYHSVLGFTPAIAAAYQF